MLADLKERLAKFSLTLHEDKTRLIEFGRLSALARRQRDERHPETFAFLGFTHYCGWTRDGRFIAKRKAQRNRLTRKLSPGIGFGMQFGVIENEQAFERYCQRLGARQAALRAKEIDDMLSPQPVPPSR